MRSNCTGLTWRRRHPFRPKGLPKQWADLKSGDLQPQVGGYQRGGSPIPPRAPSTPRLSRKVRSVPPIQFDDIDMLKDAVSDEFGQWGHGLEITQDLINRFADLTGDNQWIHVDVERARRESPFGTPVAHGFLLLSLLPCIHAPTIDLVGYSSATNLGSESLRFTTPVPAGATIRSRSRLAEVNLWPRGGTVTVTEIEIRADGSDRPALTYRMQVLWR